MHLTLPNITLLNIDGTYVRPDTAHNLTNCPQLQHVIYRQLLRPAGAEEDME